jgi:hypothetical protein
LKGLITRISPNLRTENFATPQDLGKVGAEQHQ